MVKFFPPDTTVVVLLAGHDGPDAVGELAGAEEEEVPDGTQVEFTYTVRRSPAPQYSVGSAAHVMLQSPEEATLDPALNEFPQ